MIHDNSIKTCFIVLKQVELSAGLKWAVMTIAARFATKTPGSARLEIRTRSSRVDKGQQTVKIVQI
jgi:hypothetical protein